MFGLPLAAPAQIPAGPNPTQQTVPRDEYEAHLGDPSYRPNFQDLVTSARYRQRRDCNTAALRIDRYIRAIEDDNFPFTIPQPIAGTAPLTREEFVRLAADYVELCELRQPRQDENPAGRPGEVGVLFHGNPSSQRGILPACTAMRLSDSVFLTALHCVVRPGRGDPIPLGALHVQTADTYTDADAREDRLVAVRWVPTSAQIEGYRLYREPYDLVHMLQSQPGIWQPALDYAVLVAASSSPAAAVSALPSGLGAAPRRNQQTTLVGYHHFVLLARYVERCLITSCRWVPDEVNVRQWPFAIRLDRGSTCRIVAHGPGCVLHGCQTARRASGAPLLDGASRQVAALHTRPVSASGGQCGGLNLRMGNAGLPYPSDELEPWRLAEAARRLGLR
jgi:hypothetical protein